MRPGYNRNVVTGRFPDVSGSTPQALSENCKTTLIPKTDTRPARCLGKIAAAFLLWLLALSVVVWGELLPGYSAPMRWVGATHISDKALHFVAYFGLAFIPVLGFRLRAGILTALAMIPLGVALEFAQLHIPARSFEVADMIANTCGVAAGIAFALVARRAFPALVQASGPAVKQ
jgi:VanZ family protein